MLEIVMPQLSDSMDEGKLINWKVKVGQKVSPGDVIAEVESDKAIMEVQSFKNGVVQELDANEGDVVPVGQVIAKIATQDTATETKKETPLPQEVKKQTQSEKHDTAHKKEEQVKPPLVKHTSAQFTGGISPKARAKAAQFGVDTQTIMQKTAKKVLHVDDVEAYLREHYFTPKALKILDTYGLDVSEFRLEHKIDATEVEAFIALHERPLPQVLSQMQKAIIASVTAAAQKPVYHLYESVDTKLFIKNERYSITAWLIKIFAKVMMAHEAFRSRLQNDTLIIAPTASIAIAVAENKKLYMPVIKDANTLSISEIAQELASFKQKLQENTFAAKEMQGSSFGISNLGMLGVERFDAMINKEDSAIAAIGTRKDDEIAVTLTIDHRLINGYEAALFMRDVKKEIQNSLNFKD
ncbi:dihydrolipoamide acetyltransferase family protein [Sulfurimonas sp.]